MQLARIFHQHHACSAAGGAPHLVLLHGWGLHSGVWNTFLPLLTPYFNVTVIDLPGFGKSSADISSVDFSQALSELVPEPAIWLGWSLGGLVALDFAAHYPQHVQALCLWAVTPCFVQREDWLAAMPAPTFNAFKAVVQENAGTGLQRFLALQCKGSVSMKTDLRFLQAVAAEAKTPATASLLAGLQQLALMDMRAVLAGIDKPVQVLLGASDTLIPLALANELTRLNPGVDVTLIEGAAHMPFVSHPQQCCDALLKFCGQYELIKREIT